MWKQPLVCYFSHSSLRAEIFAEFILITLNICNEAGFYIDANVHDMEATNVNTLKIMGSTYPENP